ncbi:MAG: response regulator transcription factor [Lachnospiraceae bacterium]|nr:response regulator transcription factor [Lachnospiraceae bacterium]
MKLLYAEDERDLAEAVTDILEASDYIVDTVYDGVSAVNYAMMEQYDGIILDVMMPGKDGIEVIRELRQNGNNAPVLILSAKTEVEDRITGFDSGADDYLPKPFVKEELLSRLRAMLRRRDNYQPDIITVGDLSLNTSTDELTCGNNRIVLQNLEYRLMETLMMNTTRYLTADDILSKVWSFDSEADIDTVWVYLSGLRKKIARIGSRVKIISRRNIGYRLEDK